MAARCTVCSHPDRERIDMALAADQLTCRGAAERWRLDKSAVSRHRARHLPLRLLRAAEAEEIAAAGRILSQIDETAKLATALIVRGMRTKTFDGRLAVAAMGRRLDALTLLAKVSGLMQPDVSVLILQHSPAWLELRDALVEAIKPFPEASRAVLRVLERAA